MLVECIVIENVLLCNDYWINKVVVEFGILCVMFYWMMIEYGLNDYDNNGGSGGNGDSGGYDGVLLGDVGY